MDEVIVCKQQLSILPTLPVEDGHAAKPKARLDVTQFVGVIDLWLLPS